MTGIKWHFFFYFFSGILKYLGLPIDFALNLPSIIAMSSALILIGLLANLISKNRLSFLIAPFLVLFRSAFNIFFVIQKWKEENRPIIETLFKNAEWTNTTPYDNWGLWSINVYPNQRHLMLRSIGIIDSCFVIYPICKRNDISIKKT